jgi:adenylate kinase family enzyme
MSTSSKRAFIILGIIDDEAISKVVEDLKEIFESQKVFVFKYEDEVKKYLESKTPEAKALKVIIDGGHELPESFIKIIVEDFLYYSRNEGPVAFVNYPNNLVQAECLEEALRIYRQEQIPLVLNFPTDTVVEEQKKVINYYDKSGFCIVVNCSLPDYAEKIQLGLK